MNQYFQSVKRFWYQFQDFFPTRLPVGLTAFNKWCDRLYFTYFPTGEQAPTEATQRFSIAAMVLHLDFTSFRKPNRFFGKAIRKGASNEVASYVMQDLKRKQEEAVTAARAADVLRKQLEATSTQTEADATAPQVAQGETQH